MKKQWIVFLIFWGSELGLWLFTVRWKHMQKSEKQVRWDDQSQFHHLLTSVFVGRRLVKVLLPPVSELWFMCAKPMDKLVMLIPLGTGCDTHTKALGTSCKIGKFFFKRLVRTSVSTPENIFRRPRSSLREEKTPLFFLFGQCSKVWKRGVCGNLSSRTLEPRVSVKDNPWKHRGILKSQNGKVGCTPEK